MKMGILSSHSYLPWGFIAWALSEAKNIPTRDLDQLDVGDMHM